MKAAAWAAPVVAVAASAPLAAASPGQARWTSEAGVAGSSTGTVTPVNDPEFGWYNQVSAGTISGTVSGAVNITNVVGTWSTGVITANYSFQNTNPGGSWTYNGSPVVSGPVGSTGWTATVYAVPGTARTVVLTRPSVTLTSANSPYEIEIPTFGFSTTHGAVTQFNPATAQVSVSAANISSNAGASYASPQVYGEPTP